MIPKETVEKIFETADIVEVVGDFVVLKKAGSSYKGLSPFVNEKNAIIHGFSGKRHF
ncbi:DNA primase [Parvicella tangerina]|uniref:DNA primase n=1 Tax=Parvicella tangerina TaxID=2829795 RepID=A0A916NU32_9FLAO|nr:CHC2 zinc finger domain-containing protein [Parvicella tangerina]CAG5086941.1 DNA primase [Parvicella tangerina]